MIGIIIVSHGNLAAALRDSAAMIVGETVQLDCVGVQAGEAPEDFYARLVESCEKVDTGEGTLCLSDLYGGTPNNMAVRLSRERRVTIITGANLPMVIYACMERPEGEIAQEFIDGLINAGTEGITRFELK